MLQTVTEFTGEFSRKRWMVDDYHRMIEIGLLTPNDRVELLEGQIVEQCGDYVLALQENQGNLFEDTKQWFEQARRQDFRGIKYDYYQTQEQAHGRIETRRYWVMGGAEYLIGAENWPKLTTIGCVESHRQVEGKLSCETCYYLLSLPLDAARFAMTARGHWEIENQLHWVLDVAFREDQARSISGYSGENLAVIRHIALNLLTQEKSAKGGIHAKRLKAGWDDLYLQKVLSQVFKPGSKM